MIEKMMSAQLPCRVSCSHRGLSTRCMTTRGHEQITVVRSAGGVGSQGLAGYDWWWTIVNVGDRLSLRISYRNPDFVWHVASAQGICEVKIETKPMV